MITHFFNNQAVDGRLLAGLGVQLHFWGLGCSGLWPALCVNSARFLCCPRMLISKILVSSLLHLGILLRGIFSLWEGSVSLTSPSLHSPETPSLALLSRYLPEHHPGRLCLFTANLCFVQMRVLCWLFSFLCPPPCVPGSVIWLSYYQWLLFVKSLFSNFFPFSLQYLWCWKHKLLLKSSLPMMLGFPSSFSPQFSFPRSWSVRPLLPPSLPSCPSVCPSLLRSHCALNSHSLHLHDFLLNLT